MTLKRVVLPAPLGPIRPWTSPATTSSATESRACKPPKRTETSSTASAAGSANGGHLGGIRHRRRRDTPARLGAVSAARLPPLAQVRVGQAEPVGIASHRDDADPEQDVGEP